jgi:hypothetical protein
LYRYQEGGSTRNLIWRTKLKNYVREHELLRKLPENRSGRSIVGWITIPRFRCFLEKAGFYINVRGFPLYVSAPVPSVWRWWGVRRLGNFLRGSIQGVRTARSYSGARTARSHSVFVQCVRTALSPAGPPAQRHEDPATPGGGVSDLDGISTGDLADGATISQRLTPGETRDDAFEDRACNRLFEIEKSSISVQH